MRLFWMFGLAGVLLSGAAVAQRAASETDVAASVYGSFGGSTNGNGVQQSPSNGAGFLAELHHQSNPLVGYELTYAWNRASQNYSVGQACSLSRWFTFNQHVPADAHHASP